MATQSYRWLVRIAVVTRGHCSGFVGVEPDDGEKAKWGRGVGRNGQKPPNFETIAGCAGTTTTLPGRRLVRLSVVIPYSVYLEIFVPAIVVFMQEL